MKRSRLILAAAAAITVGTTILIVIDEPSDKHATAMFSQVVGLYPGDQVRLLGVPVGTVVDIVPGAESVRVELSYHADAPVPADASAVIIAPTLVSDRFVQLSPARTSGPRLADGAVIGLDRTAVPVEFDELKDQLGDLATMLGPDGANADGSLSRAVSTAARNLDGNGMTVNETVKRLATAAGALSDGREDMFGTVRNLRTAVSALRGADGQVRGLTNQLGQLSATLADSSGELGRALDTLDSSVQRIGGFVRQHDGALTADVDGLTRVAGNLADNRQALADVLQIAPTTVANFQHVYDPFSGSITGALAATQFQDVNNVVCSMLFARGSGYDACRSGLGPIANLAHLDYPPAAFNAVQRNGSRNSITPEQGTRPDPHPKMQPPWDPAVTRPKPHQGAGTQPYPGTPPTPDDQPALARLLAPEAGTR